jgi:hypothetical protein
MKVFLTALMLSILEAMCLQKTVIQQKSIGRIARFGRLERLCCDSIIGQDISGLDEDYIIFPHTDFDGPDIVKVCMDALLKANEPFANAGLEVCWNFSTDRCRAAQGGSLEKFIEFARNPVFASMVNAQSWIVKSMGPIIPGTPTRGAMQTVLIEVLPQKGGPRDFLWSLQCERRPPKQGCWLVHECIAKENAWSQTL